MQVQLWRCVPLAKSSQMNSNLISMTVSKKKKIQLGMRQVVFLALVRQKFEFMTITINFGHNEDDSKRERTTFNKYDSGMNIKKRCLQK